MAWWEEALRASRLHEEEPVILEHLEDRAQEGLREVGESAVRGGGGAEGAGTPASRVEVSLCSGAGEPQPTRLECCERSAAELGGPTTSGRPRIARAAHPTCSAISTAEIASKAPSLRGISR